MSGVAKNPSKEMKYYHFNKSQITPQLYSFHMFSPYIQFVYLIESTLLNALDFSHCLMGCDKQLYGRATILHQKHIKETFVESVRYSTSRCLTHRIHVWYISLKLP